MKKELESLKKYVEKALDNIGDAAAFDTLYNELFSRKHGKFTALMKNMKELSDDMRKEVGQVANDVRKEIDHLFQEKGDELTAVEMANLAEREKVDVTQPLLPPKMKGHLSPITQVQHDLADLFISMGFLVEDGPELESDFYNFEALNIAKDHPARDSQDTFFIDGQPTWVMRTHTSNVQVRAMREYGAPLRMIGPGRCFRNEATDARHEHTFYQLEGLVVDKGITMAHMKGVIEAMAKHLYGEDTEVRFRPKFYPFVEPGVNGEVTCFLCKGEGCNVCKKTGWMEIFGAGMVHPNVLKAGGVDPEEYSGFAFGMGLNRLVMLKYGIEDVRHFLSGDVRFSTQF